MSGSLLKLPIREQNSWDDDFLNPEISKSFNMFLPSCNTISFRQLPGKDVNYASPRFDFLLEKYIKFNVQIYVFRF